MPVQPGSLQRDPSQNQPMPVKTSFDNNWDDMMQSMPSSFGKDMMTHIFVNGQRKRINLVAICINVFVPWMMFASVFIMHSFTFHYERPGWMWFITFCCLCVVLTIGSLAYRNRKQHRAPMWYVFAFTSLSIALTLGVVCGDLNYQYNCLPSYLINNLNTYVNVNPKVETGTQLMDAGKVYFTEVAKLDFKKAMGFKSDDMYCVIPIAPEGGNLETYDFWAVGKNCCSGTTSDFRCGEFNNPKARSGMRQIRDDERPYYRLAVQEAEAAYKIKSNHPLFFYWMQDPLQELEETANRGWRVFLLSVSCYFGVNILAVGFAIIGFSKMGFQPVF